jgi:hypothetical protein
MFASLFCGMASGAVLATGFPEGALETHDGLGMRPG